MGPGVKTKVEHYLGKGIAVATIDYPLVPESDPYRQAIEIGKALAKLDALSGQYGLDMSKVALMGHSAGAHLVDLLASNPDLARQAGYKGSWKAVVSLDTGSMDVEETMSGRHFGLYDTAFGKDEKLWARANPTRALSKDPGPMLLVCSSTRRDSCPQARAYEKKARGFGAKAVSTMPVELNHGKVNSEVGKPGSYSEAIDAFLAAQGVAVSKK
jgi:acetyl esterase/lipase